MPITRQSVPLIVILTPANIQLDTDEISSNRMILTILKLAQFIDEDAPKSVGAYLLGCFSISQHQHKRAQAR